MKILHVLAFILMILSTVSAREGKDESSFGDQSLRSRSKVDVHEETIAVMDPKSTERGIEQIYREEIKLEGAKEGKMESSDEVVGTSGRKLTTAHELFVTPIDQWNGEQWMFFLFLLFILYYTLRCLGRIQCCGCDLLDCLCCWCLYETVCDPDPGYALC